MARPRKKGKKRVAKTVVKKTRKKIIAKSDLKKSLDEALDWCAELQESVNYLARTANGEVTNANFDKMKQELMVLRLEYNTLQAVNEQLDARVGNAESLIHMVVKALAPNCPDCGEKMELVSDEEVSDEVDEEGLSGLNG